MGSGDPSLGGSWVDYPEMDAIMEEVYQARKLERRPQLENE
jgi:hypothetical protein